MSLEFTTAAAEAAREEDSEEKSTPITFEKGTKEERVIQVWPPSPGQFAMLMASFGRGSSDTDAIAGAVNFFLDLLDESDATYVAGRLMKRTDPFSKKGAEYIQGFLEDLVEEWSGRPTKSLSVSTQSPESDGPKLTPTTPTPVSSESPFIRS